jgi:TonB-dependent starch-binding outer membrane protein SusC
MKKNERGGPYQLITLLAKTLLLMKLTILLVCVFAMQSFAHPGYAQDRITLHLEGVSFKKALKAIEKQTDFRFVYNDDVLPAGQSVSISAREELLDDVMKKLLDNTSLAYKKLGKSLVIITTDMNGGGASPDYTLQVTGKVIGSDGAPIPNTSVVEKGTNNGTSTKSDGGFSITVADGNAVLVFTSVGFKMLEVPVNNRAELSVTLEMETTRLNEVVVVGYGTQRKREVTSAVSSVSAEQFNKGNISDVAQLLQGKVAGLSVARPGGDPNGGFTLRLRGLSTLGANTQPLIVLDGQIGADINTVDPNDIKSIDILKDGSAAAIYGTRGSAGVIIITTKGGSKGVTQIAYNGTVTAETPARFTPHMTAAEFRALGKGIDYGASTDWNKEITRTAISHVHNLSFSGGGQNSTYNASVNYRNSEGVAIKTGFQQINARLNLTQKALSNRLSFNLNVNATKRNSQFGFPDAFKYATIYNPTSPVYSKDPLYDLTGGGYFEANLVDYSNPVAVLQQNTNDGELKRFNFAGSAELEIVKGLKFLVRYAQQTTSNYRQAYLPIQAFISRNFLGVTGFGRHGYAYKEDNESYNQLYENILSFDKRFNKINVAAVAGYSYQNFKFQGFSARGGNFVTDASGQNLGAALDFRNGIGTLGSYKNGYKLIAFFGRVNLNYDDFVYLSASLRREGSTEFGENNKWGNFPAVSAGVDLHRLINVPDINTLKLRGSYGVTGALPPNAYLSLERLTTNGTYYAGNGLYAQVYQGTANPNPDLKWEKKLETDIGLDFALFNNRLTGSIDYFNRKTRDLIFNVTVPSPPALYNNTWKNIGELSNKGFELQLTYDVISKSDFTWTTGVTYSSFDIVLSKLDSSLKGSYVGATNLGTPGQEATQLTRAVEGQPIGILYGYRYVGVDAAGKYLFDDGTGKGVNASANPPRMVIGNGLPDFEFGWSNTFRYKNFDFNFFLRGSIGHQLINTFRAFYENPNIASSYNVVNSKYFDPAVTDAQIYSSYHVEKASFAKLDNATLGYNLKAPSKGLWKEFRSIRIYITGQNLFTITDYTGVDPEVRYVDTDNVLAPGIDRRETWVYTRSFTLGVNLGF